MGVGDGGEDGEKDKGNVTGEGNVLQGNHVVGVVIWERELGGDGGHAKSNRGIPSSGSQMDFGDDVAAYEDRKMGVALGG